MEFREKARLQFQIRELYVHYLMEPRAAEKFNTVNSTTRFTFDRHIAAGDSPACGARSKTISHQASSENAIARRNGRILTIICQTTQS